MNTTPRKRGKPVDLETLWHDLPEFALHLGLSEDWQRRAMHTTTELAKGMAMAEKFGSEADRGVWLSQLEKMRWGVAEEMLWWAAWGETFERRDTAIAKGRNLDSLRNDPASLAKHLGLKLTKPQRRWLKEAKEDLAKLQEAQGRYIQQWTAMQHREPSMEDSVGHSAAYMARVHREGIAKRKRVADGLIAKAKKQELPQVRGVLREVRTGVGLGWGKPPNAKLPRPISPQEQRSNQNSKNRDKGKGYSPEDKKAKMSELRRSLGKDKLAKAIKAFMEWSGCTRSTAYNYAEKIGWGRS